MILVNGQPRSADGKYLLSGNDRAATLQIQKTLREKGVAAVLLYTPAGRFSTDTARLVKPALSPGFITSRTNTAINVPVISVSEEKINEILAPANTTIKALQDQMNKTLQPQSMAINNTISIKLEIETKKKQLPMLSALSKERTQVRLFFLRTTIMMARSGILFTPVRWIMPAAPWLLWKWQD